MVGTLFVQLFVLLLPPIFKLNIFAGVKYMDKQTQDEYELSANIVVDCGGRNSKQSGIYFLREIGIDVKEESVDAGTCIITVTFSHFD
jgi:hypothetical protein